MFFNTWTGLARIAVAGTLAYVALIIWLRISGKRTLSKWNAFDSVVTIAIGSTLATVLLSKEVALAEGVLAFALLIALQFLITWLAVRVRAIRRLIKAEPTLLLSEGQFLQAALRAQRVTESEIRAAGIAAMEDAEAVVLETDGSFSVLRRGQQGSRSALADVIRDGESTG